MRLACVRPVSYTHLDVYKSQALIRERGTAVVAREEPPQPLRVAVIPVSYTHLDVYKRQRKVS